MLAKAAGRREEIVLKSVLHSALRTARNTQLTMAQNRLTCRQVSSLGK
jgi:hypothetical protein